LAEMLRRGLRSARGSLMTGGEVFSGGLQWRAHKFIRNKKTNKTTLADLEKNAPSWCFGNPKSRVGWGKNWRPARALGNGKQQPAHFSLWWEMGGNV